MAYRNSVVTFVDILGFSGMVGRETESEIGNMLDAIGTTAGQPIGPDGEGTKVLIFSDSVIRARALGSDSIYDALLHEIQDLAVAQWQLLEFGLLIRGGTTVGKVSLDENRGFGPAFVRAYELESSLATSPRIVIDPAVIEDIRAHLRTHPRGVARQTHINGLRHHIRQGDDGVWFIDYMNSVARTSKAVDMKASLAIMRAFIIEQAQAVNSSSLILPKYLWLIRYFNQSVRRLFPDSREMKIRASDVPASDELLRARARPVFKPKPRPSSKPAMKKS